MNERQKQIIEAAISLFLQRGVGVSTASIAKAAGVSNGTLFNAFGTKQDLIDAIYLQGKSGLYQALASAPGKAFDRLTFHQMWQGYLNWARDDPNQRQITHLLSESGLASEAAKVQAEKFSATLAKWFNQAFSDGMIRGPTVEFVGQLILLQLDLVITHNLNSKDEAQAFDMLCHSIGVTK